jgi:hypothetical protein
MQPKSIRTLIPVYEFPLCASVFTSYFVIKLFLPVSTRTSPVLKAVRQTHGCLPVDLMRRLCNKNATIANLALRAVFRRRSYLTAIYGTFINV